MKKPTQKVKPTFLWALYHRQYVTEALCPHGVGHHNGVHGCDGCCKDCPPEIWEQTTKN